MNTPRNKSGDRAEAGGWLHLAATPTFAAMALVTGVMDADPVRMFCEGMGHGSLSPGSMTFMYVLMAVFHVSPWWKRIARRTRGHTRAKKMYASELTAIEPR